jgi:hypothetical protein
VGFFGGLAVDAEQPAFGDAGAVFALTGETGAPQPFVEPLVVH